MAFLAPPMTAAWQHRQARTGFEVVYFRANDHGYRIEGCTTAVEDGQTWAVDYEIEVDAGWVTRGARIRGRSSSGSKSVSLVANGSGGWRVDGAAAPHLDGCLDVDLESSAVTNTLPVHRLSLLIGGRASVPAAYVRSRDLAVERLEQTYVRTGEAEPVQGYEYAAPAFEFTGHLVYDEAGLVVDYPGIAVRVR